MLPTSVRATIRPRSLSTPTLPSPHARSYFGWKRNSLANCESHLDPVYSRFTRYRTLKTRAKLLNNLRRRAQYYWDPNAKPFLTPDHVRFASHWYGSSRPPKWGKLNAEGETEGKSKADGRSEADGNAEGRNDVDGNAEGRNEPYELSRRERAWKEQMEAMRRRIEADPYEAVFGKRFEPFWSPLVPTWMREEMGLSGEAAKPQAPPAPEHPPKPSAVAHKTPERKDSGSYAYSSSTSWDSRSNQARRTEWNSVSGKTSHYAYDPVSGRMLPVGAPTAAGIARDETRALTRSASRSLAHKQKIDEGKSDIVSIPGESSAGSRKAVPVPIMLQERKPLGSSGQASKSYSSAVQAGEPLGPSLSEPRRFPELPDQVNATEQGLDSLTANDVRASIGKRKKVAAPPAENESRSPEQNDIEQQLREFDASAQRLRGEIADIVDRAATAPFATHLQKSLQRQAQAAKRPESLHSSGLEHSNPLQPAIQRVQTKFRPIPAEYDDSAVHEATEHPPVSYNIPKSWTSQADILQAERVRRTTSKLPYPATRQLDDMPSHKTEHGATDTANTAKLQKANALLQSEVSAHKAAMAQHEERYAHKIRSLRAELDIAYKQSSVHADEFRDQIAKLQRGLEKARKAVSEAGLPSTEQRYKDKVQTLKRELDIAYKQSSVHAEEFTERIKRLEGELGKISGAASEAQGKREATGSERESLQSLQGEGDFCANVTKFAASERWYKRPYSDIIGAGTGTPGASSEAASKIGMDRALVRDVKEIYERAYGVIDLAHRQGAVGEVQAQAVDPAAKAFERAESAGQYGFKPDGLEGELVGRSCGDVLQGNVAKKGERKEANAPEKVEEGKVWKGGYGFKDDGLEKELQGKSCGDVLQGNAMKKEQKAEVQKPGAQEAETPEEVLERNESAGLYGFKDDGLEQELNGKSCGDVLQGNALNKEQKAEAQKAGIQETETPEVAFEKNETAGLYSFKEDGLEKELDGKSCGDVLQGNALKKESKAMETASPIPTASGLEAELQNKSNERPAYASDEYEAQAAGKRPAPAPQRKTAEKFEGDGLEAELKAKGKERAAYASDEYDAAVKLQRTEGTTESLEEELKRKGKDQVVYASDEYEVAARPRTSKSPIDDLEAELKRKSKEQIAYASDDYEAQAQAAFQKAHDQSNTQLSNPTKSASDSLEEELKQQANLKPTYASDEYENSTSQPAQVPPNSRKLTLAKADSLGPRPLSTSSAAQWHYPPLYKVLAYDPSTDRLNTATTTSWTSASHESPLSITQALSTLAQPARFVERFARLQESGYQAVHAGKDVLVFRKVQDPAISHSAAASHNSTTNPVDGMQRARETVKPITGNFASPTGFVNFDPVSEAERKGETHSPASTASDMAEQDVPTRVKREEHVFTGTKRVRPSKAERREQWREMRREARLARQQGAGKWRMLTGLLVGGAGVGGLMYLAGSLEERATAARNGGDMEGVGRGRKWVLDDGGWKGGRGGNDAR